MSGTYILINLIGSVALMLWGLRMVNTGVTRAYGHELAGFLAAGLSNRFKSFAAGLGATVVLQSSTATALLTASFAEKGRVPAAMGLAIMLGADVGTTLVAQVLSFDLSLAIPILLILGYVRFQTAKGTGAKNLGRVMLGLGQMLLALKLIVAASDPIRNSEVAQFIFQSLAGEPVLTVLIAGILTFMAHSSLAVVLLVISLALTSVLPVDVAFAMVLGANLGGALPPLLATLRAEPSSRRPPLGNLICRFAGVILVLPFLGVITPYMAALDADLGRQIAHFHTLFNLGLAIVFLPFVTVMGRLVEKLIPDAKPGDEDAGSHPIYLDRAALDSPPLALSNAMRESVRMGDILEKMLNDLQQGLTDYDRTLISRIRAQDILLDEFNAEIKSYLSELSREFLDEKDAVRSNNIISFTTNIEHIGDVVVMNMAALVSRNAKKKIGLSQMDLADHKALFQNLQDNLKLAFSVFLTSDRESAMHLIDQKRIFREQERAAVNDHLVRLRDNPSEDSESSAMHLGLLSDMRRINSHIASVAYTILEKRESED